MLFFRSLLFAIGQHLSTAVFGTLGLITWPILPYRIRWRLVTLWNRFIMVWLRICCGVRLNIIGEMDKSAYPCVVMAKHMSAWETFFLQYYAGPVSTILKKELLRIPFFGWGLASIRSIAIDRSSPIQALKDVKAKGLKRLAQGNNLLVYPEGTRVAPGTVGTYARSGADIAVTAGVPIIAIAHNGADCWPHKEFVKYPGTITVVISPAFSSEGKDRKLLTEEIKTWIEGEMAKMPKGRKG